LMLHGKQETGLDEAATFSPVAAAAPADGGVDGDVELASYGSDGGKGSGIFSGGIGGIATLSDLVIGGGDCTIGDGSSDEGEKEGEKEETRLSARLLAAQQFKGSQVLATKGRSNASRFGSSGGGGISEVGNSEQVSGKDEDQENELAVEATGAAAGVEARSGAANYSGSSAV
jgi:hypothetical protein